METTTQTGFGKEAFEAFLDLRKEPGWLVDSRRKSWQKFAEMDWPRRNEEEWMRTDIRSFKLDRFSLPLETVPAATMPTALLSEGVDLGGQIATLNSQHQGIQLKSKWSDQGVLFGSLGQLVVDHEDLLKPWLLRRAAEAEDKFAALQAACWAGGHVLYVPRGVVIDEPFHAWSVMTDGGVDLGHTLVILADGAEATLLTESTSFEESDGGLHCGEVQIVMGKDSHLRYVHLQNWGQAVWHFARQKAILDRDASLQWTIAAIGSRLSKVNQQVEMVGEGASCQVNGVLFTEGKQHLNYNTLQHHKAPCCNSDFLYKAALQDKSRTVWRGMIKVDPDAQRTDGYQRNDNLLLSGNARADSIPGLEIEADDVRCTHGSTSGRVDEELIFYAQCRGFTRREAIRAIVTGFFQQIFDRVTIDSVRDALGHAISRRVREYE